jgi:hypothetical protein
VTCVCHCGSFYGCGLEKIGLRKSHLVVVGCVQIRVLLKIRLKLLLNKKLLKGVWLKLLLKVLLIIK